MNQENSDSKICHICGRPTHKESKYCIFHASAKEKTEEEFKQALKEYIQEIKEEDKDYDFERFIFIGDIDFKEDLNTTIFKNADFRKTTFKGHAVFRKATFKGYAVFGKEIFGGVANFAKATFKGYADFAKATFKGYAFFGETTFDVVANFTRATFEGDASFWWATLKGEAGFGETTFEGDADFEKATFGDDADFEKATFEGDADFEKAIFKGNANFWMATFEGDADFRVKSFIKGVTLTRIRVLSGKKLIMKVRNNIEIISLERAYLENAYLDIKLVEGILIDFAGALLKNTKIKKSQIKDHILQEKKKYYNEAKEIYLLMKNNFHSIGQYEDESWAFTKERDMEKISKSFRSLLNEYKKYSLFKKILKKSNLLRRVIVRLKIFSKWLFSKKAIGWFNLSVSDFIYQYGENPWRVIRFALIIIFLFAIILNFSGIVISDRTNLIIEFIKESQGDEYILKYLGPILGSFLNCLYFSVVTFTTLGYGDFQPAVGLSRFFVSLESIIGAITMALFVYTFARRTGGR